MGNQQQGSAGGGSQAVGGGYSASPSAPRLPLKQQEPMPLKTEVERRFDDLLVSDDGSGQGAVYGRRGSAGVASIWTVTVVSCPSSDSSLVSFGLFVT